jgi:FixJ family two-component response regulator
VVENNGLFLEKPFTIKTLADKIRRVLDEKEQALNG